MAGDVTKCVLLLCAMLTAWTYDVMAQLTTPARKFA
jgi:hypothetical protein